METQTRYVSLFEEHTSFLRMVTMELKWSEWATKYSMTFFRLILRSKWNQTIWKSKHISSLTSYTCLHYNHLNANHHISLSYLLYCHSNWSWPLILAILSVHRSQCQNYVSEHLIFLFSILQWFSQEQINLIFLHHQ